MASPIDATTLQRLLAAKEEHDQQQQVVTTRLTDTRFHLIPESAEALREAAHDVRTAVNRLVELGNVIGQDSFNVDDPDHLEHVLEEINEPNEDLDAAISRLNIPEIRDARSRSAEFDIWFAEWQVALTRFKHAAFAVLVQGRVITLVLTRRQA